MPNSFNLASALVDDHVAGGRGNFVALRIVHPANGRREDVTYGQLQDAANRAGNSFLMQGVRPGERIAIMLTDGLPFVASFLGALKIGAIAVPLDINEPQASITAKLDQVRPTLAVGGEPMSNWIDQHSARLETYPASPDQPSHLMFTSGTTGDAKAVIHLHGDLVDTTRLLAEVHGITSASVLFSAARCYWGAGLSNLIQALVLGASSLLVADKPRLDAADVLRWCREAEPTILFGSATLYTRMLRLLAEEYDPHPQERYGTMQVDRMGSTLRLCVSSGEPLPAGVYAAWKEKVGIELLDQWGSNEVGVALISNRVGQVRSGSAGLPLANCEVKIADEQGGSVPRGATGEMWIKGPSVGLGYWNQRAATKQSFVGEWLRTGDRFRMDDDGYLFFEGRVNETFKVNAQWLVPNEVEQVLCEHPAVAFASVVPEADADGHLKPVAFVILHADADVAKSELQDFVRRRLQPYKCPRRIRFVGSLPTGGNGKVQRRLVAELLGAPAFSNA